MPKIRPQKPSSRTAMVSFLRAVNPAALYLLSMLSSSATATLYIRLRVGSFLILAPYQRT